MQRLDLRADQALALIAGLAYGYRGVDMELSVLSIEEFSEEKHSADRVYYIDRRKRNIHKSLDENVSHICVIREDKVNAKISVFIYKSEL